MSVIRAKCSSDSYSISLYVGQHFPLLPSVFVVINASSEVQRNEHTQFVTSSGASSEETPLSARRRYVMTSFNLQIAFPCHRQYIEVTNSVNINNSLQLLVIRNVVQSQTMKKINQCIRGIIQQFQTRKRTKLKYVAKSVLFT